MNIPKVLRIEKIVNEADKIKTFLFRHNLNAKPGQFVMVWIPRLNEKPMSVSYQTKTHFALTICDVGVFSHRMHQMKAGDKVGIRGPYGKPFTLKGRRILLVGGGYGSAPLAFLRDEAIKKGIKVDFIIGTNSKKDIMFEKRIKKNFYPATDDGSYGTKGFATDVMEKLIRRKKYGRIYTCGPEVMMKKVVELGSDVEVSMERHMKCGMGICGQCCLDYKGLSVCKDGPVFGKKDALEILK